MKLIQDFVVVGCLFVLGIWTSQAPVQAQYMFPYSNPYAAFNNQYFPYTNTYGLVTNPSMGYQNAVAYSQASLYGQNWGSPFGFGNSMSPYAGSWGYPGYGSYNPYYPDTIGSITASQGQLLAGFGQALAGRGQELAGFGQAMHGRADLVRAYSGRIETFEKARTMREQLAQMRLETHKQRFELESYIKAHTPSFTEEENKRIKQQLKRFQTNSLPGEISSGKSLNGLLDDLRKYPNKTTLLEPMMLSEGVLSRLNVSKGSYGIGILRDDGKLTWPAALLEMLTITQRKDLDARIQNLVKEASTKGRIDTNVLKDVRDEMDKIREDLVKKVNEIPTNRYLDAKRFLQEFHEASIALERGEAANQAEFQRFIEGGKSVQAFVDHMVKNGLVLAPATANDEFAYRALNAVLAAYNVALNAQLGTAIATPTKE